MNFVRIRLPVDAYSSYTPKIYRWPILFICHNTAQNAIKCLKLSIHENVNYIRSLFFAFVILKMAFPFLKNDVVYTFFL